MKPNLQRTDECFRAFQQNVHFQSNKKLQTGTIMDHGKYGILVLSTAQYTSQDRSQMFIK